MTPQNALRALSRSHPTRMFSVQAVQRRSRGASLATTRAQLRDLVRRRKARTVQLATGEWLYRAV